MADYIRDLLLGLLKDFLLAWWWITAPLFIMFILFIAKFFNPPKVARVPLLLVACTLGGYLVGLNKPPDVVERDVVRTVEVPVDRVVEKRVEVPTVIERIKEVFVTPPLNVYGKCIYCYSHFHLDGETGVVRCPKCKKTQQAKSASDYEAVIGSVPQVKDPHPENTGPGPVLQHVMSQATLRCVHCGRYYSIRPPYEASSFECERCGKSSEITAAKAAYAKATAALAESMKPRELNPTPIVRASLMCGRCLHSYIPNLPEPAAGYKCERCMTHFTGVAGKEMLAKFKTAYDGQIPPPGTFLGVSVPSGWAARAMCSDCNERFVILGDGGSNTKCPKCKVSATNRNAIDRFLRWTANNP